MIEERKNVLTATVYKALHEKRYEAEARNKDGMRHVAHRFPIKNGISAVDVLKKDLSKTNALYNRIVKGFK